MRVNLVVETEDHQYRFRYDDVFEHLQAKFVDAGRYLQDSAAYERKSGYAAPPQIVVAACRRARTTEQASGILKALAQRVRPQIGLRDLRLLLSCATATVVEESTAGLAESLLELLPIQSWYNLHRLVDFPSILIEAPWPHRLKLRLLEYFVRACDGRDFRAKDITPPYLGSTLFLFTFLGFDRGLRYLWYADSGQTEKVLVGWLKREGAALGSAGGAESSLSSWTLCALFAVSTSSDIISPIGVIQLLHENKPEYVWNYGRGLAFAAPDELIAIVDQLARAASPGQDTYMLELLSAMLHAEYGQSERLRDAAVHAAWVRLQNQAEPPVFNRLIPIAASDPTLQESLWKLICNTEKSVPIDITALNSILPFQWDEVFQFFRSNTDRIVAPSSRYGHMTKQFELVEAALQQLRFDEHDPGDKGRRRLLDVSKILDLIRDNIQRLPNYGAPLLEELLYVSSVRSYRALNLETWVELVMISGSSDAARYLAYFAGDRHASAEGEQRALMELVSVTMVNCTATIAQIELFLELVMESLFRYEPDQRRIEHVRILFGKLRNRFGETATFAALDRAVPGFVSKPKWASRILADVLSLPEGKVEEVLPTLLLFNHE